MRNKVDSILAEQTLERLKKSEVVRLCLSGKYSPAELDSAYHNMMKTISELRYTRQLDMAEIVELRRQVDFLMDVPTIVKCADCKFYPKADGIAHVCQYWGKLTNEVAWCYYAVKKEGR